MVRGKCYAAHKEYQRCKWPQIFCENITIGDRVCEQDVDRKTAKKLYVLEITHSESQYDEQYEPFLLIEFGYENEIS